MEIKDNISPIPINEVELWKQPYSCPKCVLSPELLSINKISGMLKIKCINHDEQNIPISKSISELTKNNYYNAKCEICQKKNNIENEGQQLKYCLECKKIICKNCLNKHEKHEKNNKILNLNEINSKCNLHLEPYCLYCYKCNKSICHICISNKEHLFHKKDFLNELITQEINKDINSLNKIFKEERELLLKRAEELDNLIKLNELLMNSYKNCPNNYNYTMNLKNLFLENVLKEYKNDVLKNRIIDKFNKVNNVYISLNSKYLNFSNIIAMIPRKFSKFCELQLKNLKELVLSNTGIKDLLPFKNYYFGSMKLLSLNDNSINNLKPLEGLDMPNLEQLYLNNNHIKNIKPLGKINFPNLEILNLGYNKIYSINILSNNIFSNLKKLYLRGNKISKIDILSEVKFKNLTNLNLGENKISNISSLAKSSFNELKRLYLYSNLIEIQNSLNLTFNSLKKLELSDNNLKDLSFFNNINANKLTFLNLNNNKINDIEPIANYDFNNLICLNLSNNNINNIECLEKSKLINLQILNLQNNKVENLKPLLNLPMKTLKFLNIYKIEGDKIDNEEKDKIIEEISNKLKNIKINNDYIYED